MSFRFIFKSDSGQSIDSTDTLPTKIISFLSGRIASLEAQKSCIEQYNGQNTIIECMIKADYGNKYQTEYNGNTFKVDVTRNDDFLLSSVIPVFTDSTLNSINMQSWYDVGVRFAFLVQCYGATECIDASLS
jgi:hypothetical protein